MNSAHVVTDVTDRDWYRLRYQRCLERHGAESMLTQGYKAVLDRIEGGQVIEEMNLKVHYASAHSRPLDMSD